MMVPTFFFWTGPEDPCFLSPFLALSEPRTSWPEIPGTLAPCSTCNYASLVVFLHEVHLLRGLYQALSGYSDRSTESSHPTFKDPRRAGVPVEALQSSFCSAQRVPALNLKIKTIKKKKKNCVQISKQTTLQGFLGKAVIQHRRSHGPVPYCMIWPLSHCPNPVPS